MMWNTRKYDALVASIGTQKTEDILSTFWSDLCSRFQDENRETLGKDAHVIKSSAGLLGFSELGKAAEMLEIACLYETSSDDFFAALTSCRKEAACVIVDRRAPSFPMSDLRSITSMRQVDVS